MSTQLNRQLKEQERIADIANALAMSSRLTEIARTTHVCHIPGINSCGTGYPGPSRELKLAGLRLCHYPPRLAVALTTRATLSLSTADLFLSGLSSLTSPAVEQASAQYASQYSSVPHNHLLENEIDDSSGHDMFSMAHRTVPDSLGHFLFLQVEINYLPGQDSKTTMLMGLSALMDILPAAIDGFELHPLEEASTLPIPTNNKSEEGFPGLVILAFKYFFCLGAEVRSRRVCGTRVHSWK
jgi:hypothetical protein